jgi:hypothetical protein
MGQGESEHGDCCNFSLEMRVKIVSWVQDILCTRETFQQTSQ